jgi:hypothetical protein
MCRPPAEVSTCWVAGGDPSPALAELQTTLAVIGGGQHWN